ncbi:BRI1 kinase inhibitor 1 [Striga asiatica]|uniref:BRI1 kinase inhibitor 1 n=1 Tax=Striga asiatica TaxID=4170 RepID=A0A5A7PB05_STRAF|nr:BRI1 kinase inhibitor 1 [Striga asiatica]
MQTEKRAIEANLHAVAGKRVEKPPPPAPPSSSPSHEFSFTVSLHPPPAAAPPPHAAVDLSPADDIFFHGHLLPLHLLSHLPVSPRSSTNSTASLTLPSSSAAAAQSDPNRRRAATCIGERSLPEVRIAGKSSKSFSLFGLPKWRKSCERRQGQNRKSKFDLSRFLHKYFRLIKPLVSRGETESRRIGRQTHSFSENLRFRGGLRGLTGRREFSAPPSIGNSPTNSGLLVASGSVTPTGYRQGRSDNKKG